MDAASSVVKRRDGKQTAEIMQTAQVELPPAKSLWQLLLESNDEDCKQLVDNLIEKSETLKKEACKPEILASLAERIHNLPGLTLVGSLDDNLAQIGKETLESAQRISEQQEQLDRFLNSQIKPFAALLERGGEVTDELIETLLACPGNSTDGGDGSTPTFADIQIPSSSAAHLEQRQSSHGSFSKKLASALDQSLLAGGGIGTDASLLDAMGAGVGTSTKDATATTAGPKNKFSASAFSSFGKDRLNLTGLLNVLDGVVDSPGRMVIMTTNHVEMLDPALIRPGRIDKKLLLGYMRAVDIVSMIEHYFQTNLTQDQRERVIAAIDGDDDLGRPQVNLTPAQVEQLAAEHDEVIDMIKALEDKGAPRGNFTGHHLPSPSILPKPGCIGKRASSHTRVAFDV